MAYIRLTNGVVIKTIQEHDHIAAKWRNALHNGLLVDIHDARSTNGTLISLNPQHIVSISPGDNE